MCECARGWRIKGQMPVEANRRRGAVVRRAQGLLRRDGGKRGLRAIRVAQGRNAARWEMCGKRERGESERVCFKCIKRGQVKQSSP